MLDSGPWRYLRWGFCFARLLSMGYILDQNNNPTNFSWDEFHCKCYREDCDAIKAPDPDFLARLQRARISAGFPFSVDSWSRCQRHNDSLKGSVPGSMHVKAMAVDITCWDSRARWKMVLALLSQGFSLRIYDTHIHADIRLGLPVLTKG